MKLSSIRVLALIWLLLPACAGRSPAPQPPPAPPVDDDLMNLLPASVEFAAWLDMRALRASSLGPLLESVSQNEQFFPTPSADLLRQTDEVLIGVSAGSGEAADQFVILFKGTFDANSAAALLAQVQTEGPSQPTRAMTSRTMASGSVQMLEAVAVLAARQGTALRADPRFADFALNGDTMALRYRKGATAPELPAMVDIGAFVRTQDVISLDARLSLGQGVSLKAEALLGDPAAAAKTAKKLQREVRQLRGNMIVVLLGVDFLLEKLSVSAQEASLLLSLSLDQNDVLELGQLVERLDKIRQLTEGLGAAVAP